MQAFNDKNIRVQVTQPYRKKLDLIEWRLDLFFISVLSQLTTISDDNFLGGTTGLGAIAFNLLNNIHALRYTSEYDMLSIQPRCSNSAQEEL